VDRGRRVDRRCDLSARWIASWPGRQVASSVLWPKICEIVGAALSGRDDVTERQPVGMRPGELEVDRLATTATTIAMDLDDQGARGAHPLATAVELRSRAHRHVS
jgi:hypothetical protein